MKIIQKIISDRKHAKKRRLLDKAVRDGTFTKIEGKSFLILSAKMDKSCPDWRNHKTIVKRVKAAAHNCAVNELKETIDGIVR
jgi:hypothetical protein